MCWAGTGSDLEPDGPEYSPPCLMAVELSSYGCKGCFTGSLFSKAGNFIYLQLDFGTSITMEITRRSSCFQTGHTGDNPDVGFVVRLAQSQVTYI